MEDSLGRKIDVSNMNLAQIKSMISSMMTGNVKKSDFKTIPDQNVQALSRLGDLLKKLNSSFDRQVAQINDYVAGMKNVIREINESRKETENSTREANRTFKELDSNSKILNNLISKGNESLKRVTSAGSSRLNISISAMTPYLKAMTGSLQGMSSIFNRLIELWKPFVASGLEKGSIYVHDIYAQALLREIAKHQGVSGSDFSDIPDKLKELQALAGSKDSKELEKVMKKQNDRILKNLTGGTNKKGIMFGSKTIREMSIISGTSDFKEALEAAQLDETQITAVVDAINSGNMSGKQLKTQLMSQGFKTKDIEAVNDAFKSLNAGSNALSRQGLREATNMLESFTDNLFALEEKQSLYQSTLGGLADSAKYVVDYQKILYETSGITMASVEAQKELFNIDKQILQTGVDRKFAEVAILKNLKSGLRLNKESQKLVNAQLLTERQIGIESGSLTDEFRNLFESMKFSNIEVNELGRGLASVAKSAGISGDAMKEVLENTKKVTDTLKQQGTFTAQANTQIAGIFAEAKKLDALEPVQEVFAGIEEVAKRTKNIDGVGRLVQAAASRASLSNDIYSRTLLNNSERTREFVKAYKDQVLAYTDGIKNMDDLRKLSYQASMGDQAAKARLANIQDKFLKNYNTTAANQLKVIESMEESTAPPLEKLDKLNKKYAKGLLSKSELEEKTNEIALSSSMKLLGALGDAAEMADGTMSNVLGSFEKSVQDSLLSERDMTLGVNYPVSAEATIRNSLEQVQKGLRKNGLQELKISQKEIDEAVGNREKLTELVKTIQEAEARTRSEEQKKSNPLTAASAAMTELNNTLRDMTNSLFFQLQSTLGPNGFLYLGLGSVFATAFLKSKTFLSGPLGTAIGKQIGKIPGLRNLARANPMAALTNPMAALTHAPVIDPKNMTLGKALKGGNLYAAIEQIGKSMEAALPRVMNFGRGFANFIRHPISKGLPEITSMFNIIRQTIGTGLTSTSTYLTGLFNRFVSAEFFTAAFWRGPTGVLNTVTEAGKTVGKGFLRYFTNNPFKVFYKDLAFLSTKGVGVGLQAFGKSLSTIPVAGQIASAAIGFTIGAFQGFSNTAKNFDGVLGNMNDKTLEVTASMKAASTVGGGLAGALDFLTFGILGLTGLLEPLEKILTWLTYSVMQFFYGIFDGFMAGIQLAKPGLDSFFEAISDVFSAVQEIGDAIADALGLEGGAGGLVKAFFDFMYKAGKMLGSLIGGTLGVAFSGLGYILWGLGKVLAILVRLLKPLIKLLGIGFSSIFTGIKQFFTGDILRGIGNIFMGIYEIVLSPFTAIINWLTGWTGSLYDIVKDAFKGIIKFFFGDKGVEAFKNGIKVVADAFSNFVKGIISKLKEWTDWLGWTKPAHLEEQEKKKEEAMAEAAETRANAPANLMEASDEKIKEVYQGKKEEDGTVKAGYNEAMAKQAVLDNKAIMESVDLAARKKAREERKASGQLGYGERLFSPGGVSASTPEYQAAFEAEVELRVKDKMLELEKGQAKAIEERKKQGAVSPTQQAQASAGAAATPAPTPTQQATAAAPAAAASAVKGPAVTPTQPAPSTTAPTQKVEQAQMPKLTKRVGDPNLRLPGYGKVQLWDSDQGRIMIDSNNVMYKQGSGGKWDKIGNAPSVPQMEIGSEFIKRAGIAFLHAGEMVLPSAAAGMMAESAGAFSNDLLKPIAAASNIAQVAPSDNGLIKTTAAQKEFDRSMELSILQHRANMELFKQITDNTEKSQENLYELLDKMDKLIEQAKKSNEDFGDGDGDEYMGNSIVKLQPSSAYGRINGSAIRNMS